MSARRKFLLVVHVLSSAANIGLSVVMLVLVLSALGTDDAETASTAMDVTRFLLTAVAIPGLVVALLTGVLSALVSPWGLFVHTWVLKKLALLLVTTGFAVALLRPWAVAAAAEPTTGTMRWLVLVGLVSQLAKLVLITALSVYKPRGRWRRGRPRTGDRALVSAESE